VLAAQASLIGVRYDLLKLGICDESAVDQAGPQGIGARQFQRSGCSVGYRKVTVHCQIRRELIGPADHGIEVSVGVIAGEAWVVAEVVRQVELGEVQAPSGGNRQA
jgi:hypothetical protein